MSREARISPRTRDIYRDVGLIGETREARTQSAHKGWVEHFDGLCGPLKDQARKDLPRVLGEVASLAGKECKKGNRGKVGRVGHAWRPRRALGNS